MKRASEPTPTPFTSPERAELASAIVKAASADARKAALVKAVATADGEVRLARRAVEAADEAIEVAKSNAARHLTDTALGTAGEPPLSIREARAAAIEAADHLEACLAAREALNAEQVDVHGLVAMRVDDCAKAVIKSEMHERAIALAAKILQLQKDLIQQGSALEWLHRFGVFPPIERGREDHVGHIVERLQSLPQRWAIGTIRYAESFAVPTGGNALAAAFEALKRDANTPLPDED